jgi:hypothetical protein
VTLMTVNSRGDSAKFSIIVQNARQTLGGVRTPDASRPGPNSNGLLVSEVRRRFHYRSNRQMMGIRIAEEKIRISALERMEPLSVRRSTGGALRGATVGSTR